LFYTQASGFEGEPVRLYRSPMEIRRDICEINKRIGEADSRLNIRAVLSEMLTELDRGDPEEWVPELARVISEAEEVLSRLTELRDCLDGLNKELEDTVWVLG